MSEDMMRMVQSGAEVNTPSGIRQNVVRVGNQNDALVSQLHGSMYEQALRGNMFYAASQAATTTTVALATTYTGLCLSNPAGNSKNLIPRQVSAALSVAPAGIAPMGIGGGYAVAGVVTHTTPLTRYSTVLGSGTSSTGLADGAATLVGTPTVIMPFLGGFTAAALFATSPAILDLNGSIVIPPGGYVFIYTLTVAVGLFGITWEEVPIPR